MAQKLNRNQKLLLIGLALLIPILPIVMMMETNPLIQAKLYTIQHQEELAAKGNEIVINPVLTGNAYQKGGFYDYYNKKCGLECLTVKIDQNAVPREYSSALTVRTLESLGYHIENDFIVDYYLRTDPNFLDKYETVIVLHSEYVTQKIFDALQRHKHVIYLVPNALYGKVEINKETMTLLQGHGYIVNDSGFYWKYDNTHPYEYEKQNCTPDKFRKIENGWQLQCNPETTIYNNFELLKAIKSL